MATKEEILDVLETLIHAYPGHKYSENTFQIYIDHLSDIQPDLLRLTLKNLIDTSTSFILIISLSFLMVRNWGRGNHVVGDIAIRHQANRHRPFKIFYRKTQRKMPQTTRSITLI